MPTSITAPRLAAIIITLVIMGCNNEPYKEHLTVRTFTEPPPSQPTTPPTPADTTGNYVESFMDSINMPAAHLPYVCVCRKKGIKDTIIVTSDTMDYAILNIAHINARGIPVGRCQSLKLKGIYPEGDLDGDGLEEIGVLDEPDCNSHMRYKVYTFKKGNWEVLYNLNSNIIDRMAGVDYFKRKGSSLRIIRCPQSRDGFDTSYYKMPLASDKPSEK